MASTKDIANDLNHLISLNVDGLKGYRDAGNETDTAGLRLWMFNVQKERAHFVSELQQIVRSLGHTPEDGGSFLGKLHRAWIDVKGEMTDEVNEEMIEECIRGEEKAVEDYRKVLDHDLPAQARGILQQQLDQIQADLHKLNQMERTLDKD